MSQHLVLLLGLARRDVKRRSRWSERLGEDVHPHHEASLKGEEPAKYQRKRWLLEDLASPAGCPAAAGCTALWSPRVQVPVPASSR